MSAADELLAASMLLAECPRLCPCPCPCLRLCTSPCSCSCSPLEVEVLEEAEMVEAALISRTVAGWRMPTARAERALRSAEAPAAPVA